MKKSLIAATIAAALASGSAAAAVIDFNFGGNGGLSNQHSFTSGSLNVTAKAGVHLGGGLFDESGIFPRLGQYEQGLGVTGYPLDLNHSADNLGGDEYVRFAFDQAVQVQTVTVAYQYRAGLCVPFFGCVTPSVGDADASYLVGGTPNGTWQSASVNPSHRSSGWYEYTFALADLAMDEEFRFGARLGQTDDSFKILGMSVLVNDPAQVPMPAPLMLLGAGLLALGASRRSATSSSAAVSR
jgi:hypothetical protein